MSIPVHPVFAALPGAFVGSLGTSVSILIGAGPAKTVRAIVRAPSAQIVAESGYSAPGMTGRIVTASFAAADVAGIAEDSRVTIAGVDWLVKEPLPDGRGMVRCELERAT